MELQAALKVAERILNELKPHCYKCAVAGSIRRREPFVKDIEILIVPKPYEVGLFSSGIATVVDQWEKVKGELPCKYTQRKLPDGINLDLFLVEEMNWGLQYAIRTGPAEYSHQVLAYGWVKKGFKCEGGYLYKNDKKHGLREEQDLFNLIGIKYVPADRRFI